MSEQIPVNLLKEGKINDWNEWRSQHSDQHLDLTNTDLSSLDLTGANFSNSNLSGVDLTGANLQDTDFTEVSNIKDIIIRNEKEDDFRNACRLLLETGGKFFSINFDDQSGCYESEAGLEAIFYEYFNNYYQSIDYSKYDEFLGVYMVDSETASYFAVINWGKAHEDEDGGWSFQYIDTTAEYNGENISESIPFLEEQYGGEHPPDVDKMERYLIKMSQKGRDLSNTNLEGANLEGVNLKNANLKNANLKGANLKGAYLKGAYFFDEDDPEIEYEYNGDIDRYLDNIKLCLEDANLSDANLSRANLSRADLSRADLQGSDLSNADLSGANLSGAYLSCADLQGSDLSDANLSSADLSSAYLSGANLSRANLSGADLTYGADLTRADLSGADLSGANLTDADLTDANLEEIITDENTIIEIPEE